MAKGAAGRGLGDIAQACGGEAMHAADDDRVRRKSQQNVYHLMTSVAGDLPNYEEAIRALFAANGNKFFAQISDWPEGLRSHLTQLSADAFASQ